MKNKCLSAIEKYNMLNPGDTVVIGVSGGADSMALLHFLYTHSDLLKIRVIAAHFHHGIRGVEADRDQAFVREYCNNHGIDFVTAKENIPEISRRLQLSAEECARNCRYNFLQSVYAGAKIATAHTNSDSCESFLFNFARGTGLQGLCGIPAVRDNIIRPLIFCSSEDTRKYCSENAIQWCEDSTNRNDLYSRNSIRLHTVPSLKKINAQFEDNALRCMRILQSENDFLKQTAMQAYSDCVDDDSVLFYNRLNQYHAAIQTRVMLQFVRNNGCNDVSMKQVERLLSAASSEVFTLNGAIRFRKNDNSLRVICEQSPQQQLLIKIDAETDCVRFYDSLVYFKHEVHNNDTSVNDCAYIDADKISSPVLRTRKAGDAIRIKERNCTKTIKQLFSERKIPLHERLSWPVLADDNGVIWIGGFGIDESRLADKDTKRLLKIEWRQTI